MIQPSAGFDSTGLQYHVSPCNSHGSLFLSSQACGSIIFSYLLHATQCIEQKESLAER